MVTSTKASAKVVDFSNVKEAGQFAPRRVPAGDYAAKIVKVEDGKSSKDGEFQYVFTIKLVAFSQNSYPYYCKLQENQLWKLRNLLIAGGINVPKRKASVDPNRLAGKTIGVTMGDDEYEGKEKSTIEAVFPASELDDTAHDVTADDDEEAAYAMDDEDGADEDVEDDEEPEETEVDEGDDFDGMDRTELKAWLKVQDPAFQARKSQTDDDLREMARAMNAADDEEEEDEEEEPPPPPVRRTAKKAAAKPKQTADEELEELDIEDL